MPYPELEEMRRAQVNNHFNGNGSHLMPYAPFPICSDCNKKIYPIGYNSGFDMGEGMVDRMDGTSNYCRCKGK